MKSIITLFVCILIVGCIEPITIVNERDVGQIMDAEVVQTTFNERIKMRIKTEKAVVIIYGTTTVPLGVEAKLYTYSDKKMYFSWDELNTRHRAAQ